MPENMTSTCPICGIPQAGATLKEAFWASPGVLDKLTKQNPRWQREDGACPACVQQALLQLLLEKGDAALHERIQTTWPLDAEAAFGAIPTPLRLHADPRYTGEGVTIALIDSAFYPHPDLIHPTNRLQAWVDAGREPVRAIHFRAGETPRWPGWDAVHPSQWHGLMTSVATAGNGWLSHGLYRGLASNSSVILVQVRDSDGRITDETIARGLSWLHLHGSDLGVQVVNLSVGGEGIRPLAGNPVDEAVAALVAQGIVVVAAAGNDGQRRLVPPATAPEALTIGGLDDHNTFSHEELDIWHSNYGQGSRGRTKPELVAPSIWIVAPLLPGSDIARKAKQLFDQRAAQPVAGAAPECQGAGALDAGQAVALAMREEHGPLARWPMSPHVTPQGIRYLLHEHNAEQVQVLGSWNAWLTPGLAAVEVEAGIWEAHQRPLTVGRYSYKFLVDHSRWLDDPSNSRKSPDGFGGINSMLEIN